MAGFVSPQLQALTLPRGFMLILDIDSNNVPYSVQTSMFISSCITIGVLSNGTAANLDSVILPPFSPLDNVYILELRKPKEQHRH